MTGRPRKGGGGKWEKTFPILLFAAVGSFIVIPVSAEQTLSLQDAPGEVSSSATPGPEGQVSAFLQEAERNNPGLKAAYNQWQGALERIPQVSSLNDPKLSYLDFLHELPDSHDFELGIMQEIPFPGKLPLRARMAAEEARAQRQEFERERLMLRQEVKDAFYEYYYLEQSIRITAENLELLKHFESVANARYEVGKAGNQDVIKAQVELGQLENDLQALIDFRRPVQARLNASLNRPQETEIPPPQGVDLEALRMETQALLDLAYENNPDIRALDARIQKQRAQVELARKDYKPDFELGLNWVKFQEAGESEVEGMVRMNLPVYRKRLAAGVREAESGVREFEQRKQDMLNQISVDLQTSLYKLRNAQRQIDLYSNVLIPKAKQSVQVTQTAYSAETAGFLDLVDAERVLLDFQKNYYRSVADYGQALATIEEKVGAPFGPGQGAPIAVPSVQLNEGEGSAAPLSGQPLTPEENSSIEP